MDNRIKQMIAHYQVELNSLEMKQTQTYDPQESKSLSHQAALVADCICLLASLAAANEQKPLE